MQTASCHLRRVKLGQCPRSAALRCIALHCAALCSFTDLCLVRSTTRVDTCIDDCGPHWQAESLASSQSGHMMIVS